MAQPYQTPWDANFMAAMQTPSMFGRTGEPKMFNPMNLDLGQPSMETMALQMMLSPIMGKFMGQHRMLPSQFSPVQNFYDQLQQQQYHAQQNQAATVAAKRDVGSMQRTFAGMMRMTTGKPLTIQQQRQTFEMAQQVEPILPFVSMVLGPETSDMLMGSRGSATEMSRSIHRGLRASRDPVTGSFGVAGRSAGLIANEVFEELYGTRERAKLMGGLGAGRAGQLFEELNVRGMIPTASAYMPIEERLRSISRRTYTDQQERRMAEAMLSARGTPINEDTIAAARGDMQKTQQLIKQTVEKGERIDVGALASMPGAQEMLTQADATRISSRLREMSGAVSAMREIFGDAGHPNAPMRELINGLEALTQGGMSSMSPGQLETMVRVTRNLASQSGIGVQGMLGLTAQAGSYGDQLGLDRTLAPFATQGAAAFASAFRDTSRPDIASFGTLSPEQAALLDQKLRQNSMASFVTNSMASIVRMEQEGLVDENSEVAKVARALRAGDASMAPKNYEEYKNLMQRSGVDHAFGRSILEDRYMNQEYTRDFGLERLGRGMQAEVDLMPRIRNIFSGGLRQSVGSEGLRTLQDRGIVGEGRAGQEKYRAMMMGASEDAAREYLALSDRPEIYKNPERMNEAMKNIVQQSLTRRVKDAGGTDADVAALIEQMGGEQGLLRAGVMLRSNLNREIQFNPKLQGYKSDRGLLQMQSRDTLKNTESRLNDAKVKAEMQSAMSKLGRNDPLTRLVDAIQDAPADQELGKTLSDVFGGIPLEELEKQKPFTAFKDNIRLFRDAERFGARTPTRDEIERRASQKLGLDPAQMTDDLRRREADVFKEAETDLQREYDRQIGMLTPEGLKQRALSASIMEGLSQGGVRANQAMEEMGDYLGNMPGMQDLTRQIESDTTDQAKKSSLRRARRDRLLNSIDAALGSKNLSPQRRRELERYRNAFLGLKSAVKGQTSPKIASDMGLAMNQQVNVGDVSAVLDMAKRLEAPEAQDAASMAALHNKFLESGEAVTDGLMASAADMEHLGSGGTSLVREQRDRVRKLADMASGLGVTPGDLLAGNVPKGTDPNMLEQAKKLREKYVNDLRLIEKLKGDRFMPGFGTRKGESGMGKHEVELAETMANFASGSMFAGQGATNLRKAQIDLVAEELMKQLSTGSAEKMRSSKIFQGNLQRQLREGDRFMPLAQSIIAREEIVEMATEQGALGLKDGKLVFGADAKDARKLTETELRNLSGESRQKAIDALNKMELDDKTKLELDVLKKESMLLQGLGREGMDMDELRKRVDKFQGLQQTRAPGGDATSSAGWDNTKSLTISGSVRIENNEMLALNGQATPGGFEHNDVNTQLLQPISQSVS